MCVFFLILVSVVFNCGCWGFVLLGFHVILVLLVFLSPFVGVHASRPLLYLGRIYKE